MFGSLPDCALYRAASVQHDVASRYTDTRPFAIVHSAPCGSSCLVVVRIPFCDDVNNVFAITPCASSRIELSLRMRSELPRRLRRRRRQLPRGLSVLIHHPATSEAAGMEGYLDCSKEYGCCYVRSQSLFQLLQSCPFCLSSFLGALHRLRPKREVHSRIRDHQV